MTWPTDLGPRPWPVGFRSERMDALAQGSSPDESPRFKSPSAYAGAEGLQGQDCRRRRGCAVARWAGLRNGPRQGSTAKPPWRSFSARATSRGQSPAASTGAGGSCAGVAPGAAWMSGLPGRDVHRTRTSSALAEGWGDARTHEDCRIRQDHREVVPRRARRWREAAGRFPGSSRAFRWRRSGSAVARPALPHSNLYTLLPAIFVINANGSVSRSSV